MGFLLKLIEWWLMPMRAELVAIQDQLDTLEWRVMSLERWAARQAFDEPREGMQ